MIARQQRLFGKYNKETGKADILPCKVVGKEAFEAEAKSKFVNKVAEEVAVVFNKMHDARARGDEAAYKELHDEKQKLKRQRLPVYCFQFFSGRVMETTLELMFPSASSR